LSAGEREGEIKRLRKMWRGLWWRMAGEVKSEYERIKGTDVFEFFPLFDLWFESVKKRTKDLQSIPNGKRK